MTTTTLSTTSRNSRLTNSPSNSRKAVPVGRVEELLREIVIAMHATRPIAKAPYKAKATSKTGE